MLLREAKRLNYPIRLIRLAIITYRLPRVIRVGQAYSDLMWAMRGIVAGSGLATTEMRIVMIDIVDAALIVHPSIVPTLFVDDLSAEHEGDEEHGDHDWIVCQLGGFTEAVIQRIHDNGMEVSQTKSVVSASNGKLAAALMARLDKYGIKYNLKVKSLGSGWLRE